MSYVFDKTLVLNNGDQLGPFSSHWAACAAMIRRSDPGFKSTGGDKATDLALEEKYRTQCAEAA